MRRRAVDGRDDCQKTVFHADRNADPAKFAFRFLFQDLHILRRQKIAVGIEAHDHAGDRTEHQIIDLDFIGINIVFANQLQDFHQQINLLQHTI